MNRLLAVAFLLAFITTLPHPLPAQSFKDFKKQQEAEQEEFGTKAYDRYKAEVMKEFEIYREIVEKEFSDYKKEILKQWKEAEVSDAKKWVEYSSDYRTKRVVDFAAGQIRIEMLADSKRPQSEQAAQLKKILADLLMEDKKAAFERDSFAQNVEKKVKKGVKHVKTDRVKKEPILAPLFLNEAKPSQKAAEKKAAELIGKTTLKKRPSVVKGKEVVQAGIPLPPKSILTKAKYYEPTIKSHARKREIDGALVFAVIHTESAFNPMARSQAPAYGLMQIVPRSAGMEVTEFLHGKASLLSPSYLYNDENNISIGATYLHILYHRYMKKIENPESRLYCAIAAYNTGPGNVAKAFTGKRNINKAVPVINGMTPKEVYQKLRRSLPYEETRHYVKRVTERMALYSAM